MKNDVQLERDVDKLQWSADNLVPRCHIWKETKRCFNSIQTGNSNDIAMDKNRVDAWYVDKIFTFMSSCFVDLPAL